MRTWMSADRADRPDILQPLRIPDRGVPSGLAARGVRATRAGSGTPRRLHPVQAAGEGDRGREICGGTVDEGAGDVGETLVGVPGVVADHGEGAVHVDAEPLGELAPVL